MDSEFDADCRDCVDRETEVERLRGEIFRRRKRCLLMNLTHWSPHGRCK